MMKMICYKKKLQGLRSQIQSQKDQYAAELDEAFQFFNTPQGSRDHSFSASFSAPSNTRNLFGISPAKKSKDDSVLDKKQSPTKQKNVASTLSVKNWAKWGIDDVVKWLKKHNFEQYIETFRDCECQGEDLEIIGDQELREEFEIESASDRKLILEKIQTLIKGEES